MPQASLRLLFAAILATTLTALLAGCGSTQVRQRWSDPTDNAGPPRKLAVFVAVDDPNVRRIAENLVTRALPRPPEMVAGHTLGLAGEPEQANLQAQLVAQGFDAALVARLISCDTTRREVPPQTYFTDPWLAGPWPYFYYQPFYPWYPAYPYAYTVPGYVVETTHVVVETQLYRLPSGKPVWSAITDTTDPSSSAELVEELLQVLTRELRRAGLLPSS